MNYWTLFWNKQGKKKRSLFWIPAIAPLISVIVATFFVYITRADENGVQIVSNSKTDYFSAIYFFPVHVFCRLKLNEVYHFWKVKHIQRGINPSSVHKIYFDGRMMLKGFKIGVIAGLIGLTVTGLQIKLYNLNTNTLLCWNFDELNRKP